MSIKVSAALFRANDDTRRQLVKAIEDIESEQNKHSGWTRRFGQN